MLISVLFIMGQLLLDWGNGRAGGPAIRTTGMLFLVAQLLSVHFVCPSVSPSVIKFVTLWG